MDLLTLRSDWQNINFKFIGIYSKNTVRYLTIDIACGIYGITSIPIYDTLGEEATNFAFKQTQMKTCFTTCDHIESLLNLKKNQGLFESLKNIIVLDTENFTTNLKEKFENIIKFYTFEEIYNNGQENNLPWPEITPETIYAFSYTSGTTGQPKGAMISHRNVCSCISSSKYKLVLDEKDTYISYLPMAHSMERVTFNLALAYGCKIGLYGGNNQKVTEDMAYLKPTVFTSVPRVFNKIYQAMLNKVENSNFLVKGLFNSALARKLHHLHDKGNTNHWFYDKFVMKKAKGKLGGNVRVILTGSAPIS